MKACSVQRAAGRTHTPWSLLAACMLVLTAACSRPAEPQKKAPPVAAVKPVTPPNLLEISRGAAVVSRTGEALLTASALRAIDGDDHTMWVCPPGDPDQTLVYALPARSRIDKLGVRIGEKEQFRATSLQFDLSLDGTNFTPAKTFVPKLSQDPQLVGITPTEAAFVRVRVAGVKRHYVQIGSLLVSGTVLDPVKPGTLGGCFSLNGRPASFTQEGSGVVGTLGDGTFVEGGSDGRFYRFAWIRGPEYGLSAVTVTPDGNHAAALVWHEEAIQATQFQADDLLGDRVPCSASAPHQTSVFRSYLERFRYYPLFGLRFDDSGALLINESAATLNEVTAFLKANPNLPVRFAAHDLLQATPDLNRRLSQAKLESLRAALQKDGLNLAHVTFEAFGAEKPHREASIDLTRAMYSSVDLELKP